MIVIIVLGLGFGVDRIDDGRVSISDGGWESVYVTFAVVGVP